MQRDGESVIEILKLPDFEPLRLKVVRGEEKAKRLVIQEAELVP